MDGCSLLDEGPETNVEILFVDEDGERVEEHEGDIVCVLCPRHQLDYAHVETLNRSIQRVFETHYVSMLVLDLRHVYLVDFNGQCLLDELVHGGKVEIVGREGRGEGDRVFPYMAEVYLRVVKGGHGMGDGEETAYSTVNSEGVDQGGTQEGQESD